GAARGPAAGGADRAARRRIHPFQLSAVAPTFGAAPVGNRRARPGRAGPGADRGYLGGGAGGGRTGAVLLGGGAAGARRGGAAAALGGRRVAPTARRGAGVAGTAGAAGARCGGPQRPGSPRAGRCRAAGPAGGAVDPERGGGTGLADGGPGDAAAGGAVVAGAH